MVFVPAAALLSLVLAPVAWTKGSDEDWLRAKRLCSHELLTPKSAPIDHTAGRFLLQPAAACAGQIFLLVFVHSAVGNRQRRDLIRRTWASVANIDGDRLATFFVVGRSDSAAEMRQLQQEAQEAADLLQPDFLDTYRNLTYKDLYAIKWAARNCRSVRFVMKTDDDVMLNVFSLREYLRDSVANERNFVLCERCKNCYPLRNKDSRWRVSKAEWPLKSYPPYCRGMAYLMSADTLPQLHLCSKWRRYFWIEDVFVTGSLVQAMGVRLLQLDSGWQMEHLHPRFVGPEVKSVLILMAKASVSPILQQKVWRAMIQHRM